MHKVAFDELAALLRVPRGDELVFCPSPGNWGDSLINAGAREFFSEYDFDYREVRRNLILDDVALESSHVVVGGGGGWCQFWYTTPELVTQLLPRVAHVTVLPTTFAAVPVSVPRDERLTLIARDDSISIRTRPDALFCHDMAFMCRDGSGLTPRTDKNLLAFRQDKESAFPGPVSRGNRDLSLEGGGYDDPRPLYWALSEFSSIHTDRLHLGIAGAQLGLEVHLYSSGYDKILPVFYSSITKVFSNVTIEYVKDRPCD